MLSRLDLGYLLNNPLKSFYKKLPLINFFIGSTALTFQITILNPWHSTISKQINELQNQIQSNQIQSNQIQSNQIQLKQNSNLNK
jgi:hypothetical protein